MTGIRRVGPREAADGGFVAALAGLVNAVYAVAERGLWVDGAERTSTEEMAGLVRDGEVYVLKEGEEIAGSMRFRTLDDDACELGMLVAAPDRRGKGIGRDLLARAVEETRVRGRGALRLELLVPREWRHPEKEFLAEWYGRNGFRVTGARAVEEPYPQLAPLLATPCDLRTYERPV